MQTVRSRQVHLDFHTSEMILNVAENFNAKLFAQKVKEAHINSITVFSRCHHGWLYYPSTEFPELIHPQLKTKDLLIQQVKALHSLGINAPIYLPVQWDYQSSRNHPEWLIRKKDGGHEGNSFLNAGFYQALCVNTEYANFLRRQTVEVCEILGDELDGLFFDITGVRPCYCPNCLEDMRAEGVDIHNEQAVELFAKNIMDKFRISMTEQVNEFKKDCTIFYNGPFILGSKESFTHFEIESLPSGEWGYLHFPVLARYSRNLHKDCIGMTGKFHTSWGDFHSYKNKEALEYECFRMLSYGFAASIGDQLHPSGVLNDTTYKLIGSVYEQMEAREQWARPSEPVVEAAIICNGDDMLMHQIPSSIFGATQMLEELALQFDIVDTSMDIGKYPLIFLTDDLMIDSVFEKKLKSFCAAGGKIIACNNGGLNENTGEFPDWFGFLYKGESIYYPNFIKPVDKMAESLAENEEYVIYERGTDVSVTTAKILAMTSNPYFNRDGDHFCSHSYTPSSKAEGSPAIVKNDYMIYFSHPLFTQYRKNAPRFCKQLIQNAISLLKGNQLISHNGPSTLGVSLLEQAEKQRYTLHLLSYIPVRKSTTIDIIEDRTPAVNVKIELYLDKKITSARLVPEDVELDCIDSTFTVPLIDGYQIVEINYM